MSIQPALHHATVVPMHSPAGSVSRRQTAAGKGVCAKHTSTRMPETGLGQHHWQACRCTARTATHQPQHLYARPVCDSRGVASSTATTPPVVGWPAAQQGINSRLQPTPHPNSGLYACVHSTCVQYADAVVYTQSTSPHIPPSKVLAALLG